MAADPLASLAAEAISKDDALRRRINKFVSNVLDEAEYLMVNGNPKAKGDLISKLIPHLVKQMGEQAEDEAIAKMRAELTAFYAAMGDRGLGTVPAPPEPDIPVDGEPVPRPLPNPAPVTPIAPSAPVKPSASRTRVRVSKKPAG